MQYGRFAAAIHDARHAKPAGMFCTGQCDIQKAKIFLQAFAFDAHFGVVIGLQVDPGLPLFVMPRLCVGSRVLPGSEQTKGNMTTGYCRPLDLWMVITLTRSASLSRRTTCSSAVSVLRSLARLICIAKWRVRACSPSKLVAACCSNSARCCRLVKHALTVWFRQEACRQIECMQKIVQHGQHAVALPDNLQVAELFAALFPISFVVIETIEFREAAMHSDASQRRSHGAVGGGCCAGLKPQQHVGRLCRRVNRIPFRHVHTGYATLSKRVADGAAFTTVSH